jgi:hypothetical protein
MAQGGSGLQSTRTRLLAAVYALLALVLLGISACGGGGGGGVIIDPNGTRPVITSITPNSVNPGDRVVITGLNFGQSQGQSSVTLGGVTFTIDSWTDTEIDATVPTGVSSGVLAVIVNGLVSQSGSQAQVFIGPAPNGAPVLNTLNPNFGRMGTDAVTLIGENFGLPANGKVFFSTVGGATIQANVVPQTGGTGVQWSSTSIVVYVPATAVSGPVYVQAGTSNSNSLPFTVLPAPDGLNPPVIDSVTSQDENIGIGSIVSVNGTNFGNKQGGSTITINGLFMQVINWGATRIDAIIPNGASTSPITVTVGGKSVVSSPVTIGNKPVITGLAPSAIQVGQPLDVYGNFFGAVQGNGTLRIGGTIVPVDTWDNVHIHANSVPAVTADNNNGLKVTVTNDANLTSAEFAATLFTNLKAQITVLPTAGVAGTTEFVFTVEPSGGTGPYTFRLMPSKSAPDQLQPSSPTSPLKYKYTTAQLNGAKQKTFDTAVVVTDTATGESAAIDGPSVLVVGPTQPVITQMSVGDFLRGVDSPNDWLYEAPGADLLFNRFTFFQQQTTFASYLYQKVDQGSPVANFERNEASYKNGGSMPRGIIYRYNQNFNENTDASVVHIQGLNFGGTMGTVTLALGTLNELTLDTGAFITLWEPTQIEFTIPPQQASLSGKIKITTSTGESFTSTDNLNFSAFITSVNPSTNVDPAGVVGFSGFDFYPPVEAGHTGNNTYLYWVVKADYNDPFTGGTKNDTVRVVTPFTPDTADPFLITFNMSRLNGCMVEVFNQSRTSSAIVPVTALSKNSQYFCYLWTGAITPFSAPGKVVANSGVMSQAVPVNVGAGGGGGGGLDAVFQADKTTVDTFPPPGEAVTFTFSATGGTAPYLFEVDYEGDGTYDFNLNTAGSTPPHNYAPGTWQAKLRVTDSASGSVTKTVNIIANGPPGP